MAGRTITCEVCGLVAREIVLDGKPTLTFDIEMMEECCSEPGSAAEHFPCPHLHRAAIAAGMDGSVFDHSRKLQ